MSTYKPGDIVVVSFPFSDVPTSKIRPALVISNTRVNSTGDYILMQITSRDRKDAFSIPINEESYIGKPLPLKSFLRSHKIFTLNGSLIQYRYTRISAIFRKSVIRKILSNIA